MVKSELLQRLCNYHPNLLRKDVEKIIGTIFCYCTYLYTELEIL